MDQERERLIDALLGDVREILKLGLQSTFSSDDLKD